VTQPLSRRHLLSAAAGAGAGLVLGGSTSAFARSRLRAVAATGSFPQGVAAGEPATNAITLWTRLAGVSRSSPLRLEIATDRGFAANRVVRRATVGADAATDFTVHARVGGLRPGSEYFYRFATRGGSSEVGRFRTARPADSREAVRIGFFSCQEYIAGYFAAHRDMARQDLDLVVCLGDYVYEQAFAGTGAVVQPVREDRTAPDGEAQTLEEYRRKYQLYNADPDLRAMRRQFALLSVWDDHEVEDNYADGRPGGAARNRRVPFEQRKANGYRAFFEHLPRVIRADRRIYGRVPLGVAELFLLDTRQYRDDQPCNPTDRAFSDPCPPTTTGDPARTLLGAQQKGRLLGGLRASRAPWRVIANQVMITSLDTPPRNPLNTDSWDGYAAERRELVEAIDAAPGDTTFITGDIHTYFAGDVTRTGRQAARGVDSDVPPDGAPVATEFVGSAVSSPGIVDRQFRSEAERNAAAAVADAIVLGNNPQLTYANQAYKGYGILEVSRERLGVTYRAVRDARERGSGVFALRRFEVAAGTPVVQDRGGPIPLPAPAPAGTPIPGLPRATAAGAAR